MASIVRGVARSTVVSSRAKFDIYLLFTCLDCWGRFPGNHVHELDVGLPEGLQARRNVSAVSIDEVAVVQESVAISAIGTMGQVGGTSKLSSEQVGERQARNIGLVEYLVSVD